MKLALVVLALLAAAPASAQELGRLFFTPEQRAALDQRRRARVPDKPAAVVVASPQTRVDGYVKRSTGPSTVFINGEALSESAPEAPRIDPNRTPGGSVTVTIGEGGTRAQLRPGETLDRGNGEVRDVLGGGQINVRRSP